MEDIEKLRNEIDKLDCDLIELLEKRFAICEKIWGLKKSEGIELKDPEREVEIKGKFKDTKLPEGFIDDFFELFFREAGK
ncbi:MAG: chorismate mutase [archaeon]